MAARAGFGRRLELAIVRSGTTKGALAKRLGKSAQQVSNWLRREDPPSPGVVDDIATALGVPKGWLAFGEGEDEERPEDAAYTPGEGGRVAVLVEGPTDAAYIVQFARTMLVDMEGKGHPLRRRRGAWEGFRSTLVEVLGTVPQWWWDEYEKLGGGRD